MSPLFPNSLRIAGDDRLPVTFGKITDFADDPIVGMRRLWATHGEICAYQEETQRIHFVFGPNFTCARRNRRPTTQQLRNSRFTS